jgi:hypothetical protein
LCSAGPCIRMQDYNAATQAAQKLRCELFVRAGPGKPVGIPAQRVSIVL